MKILVCIKQVPDMESQFTVNSTGDWFDNEDLVWRMNEYDEYAVEQAVQLKEQTDGADLTVLSIGPQRVQETIKKALAMGCDRGVHIVDEDYYRKDPFEIASIIAEFAKNKDFDIVFTGMQSQDRGSAQVGILIAEILDIPGISTIVDFAYEDGRLIAMRELEGGVRAKVSCATPALVTCQLGLNSPRYPTLPNIMKAKKKELSTFDVAELHKVKAKLVAESLFFPDKKAGGIVLEGETGEVVDQLINVLKEKTTALA